METSLTTSGTDAIDLDWSEHERRQYERYRVDFYLRVVNPNSGAILGDVVDISQGGFKLIGCDMMTSGLHRNLHLEYRLESGHRAVIAFDAECVWQGVDEATGLHDAGFAYRELSSTACEEIALLIAQLSS